MMPKNKGFRTPLVCLYSLLVLRMRLLLVTAFQACVNFDKKKENIKYNPFDDISISFNPSYVKENSHNKFTLLHWLICNAEWKFFNSFWLLKQNTFSQSCANSVTKSKRTLLKNAWFMAVECLNSLRTWRSRGHVKSTKDYYCET